MNPKRVPEHKILRSCYFQASVLRKAESVLKEKGLTPSSFANYCIKLCMSDKNLLSEVEAMYLLDRSKSLRKEYDYRERVSSAEKKSIKAALKLCKGNKTAAAKKLKINRNTLINKMDEYKIKRTAYTKK